MTSDLCFTKPTAFRHFASYGGGIFGPCLENKVTVDQLIWNLAQVMVTIIIVNMQNFKVLIFLFLEIWRHKVLPLQKRTSHLIRYLPLESIKIDENHFLCWETSFEPKIIPLFAFPWFSSKTEKFVCSIFLRSLILKSNCSNLLLLVNWFR